jgi:hypothetical protein
MPPEVEIFRLGRTLRKIMIVSMSGLAVSKLSLSLAA